MKTILVLLMITGISLCSIAQNKIMTNEFQKKDFNEEWRKEISANIDGTLKFKTDTSINGLRFWQKLPGKWFQMSNPDSVPSFEKYLTYELRMPVARGGEHFNMPIAVPDSTVHYYIKEKRIQFVNPLKHEHK